MISCVDGEDFMFEITKEELLRCQIGTLKKGRGQHIKYMPFAFTELGVAMLSSVLNSKQTNTRTQLELINQTLAELQVQKKLEKPRRPIAGTTGCQSFSEHSYNMPSSSIKMPYNTFRRG
jgi:hypothetical protein